MFLWTVAPVLIAVCGLAFPAWAIDITTDYVYDDLYRLKQVILTAEVNGQPPRTLYTTTYTYDKNGNRIGMTKAAAAPEIDEVIELDRQGSTVTFEIKGFGFQVGMEITLMLGDGTLVTGVVMELTPSGAIVEFDYTDWPPGTTSMTVLNPDSQQNSSDFTRTEYTLSVTPVGSGTVSESASPPYYLNDQVQLTPTPDPGWEFDGWSDDLTGNAVPGIITMDTDKSVTATFKEEPTGLPAHTWLGLALLILSLGTLGLRKTIKPNERKQTR